MLLYNKRNRESQPEVEGVDSNMVTECGNFEVNIEKCNCTYSGCPKKGKCCECLQYHLSRRELPGCVFPDDVEKTWDRSFEKFIEVYS